MNILHLSTTNHGGAAQSAIRIHHSLQKKGFNSHFLTTSFTSNQTESFTQAFPNYRWLTRKLSKAGISINHYDAEKYHHRAISGRSYRGVRQFNAIRSDYKITEHTTYREADIIHLHWVANFLDWREFFTRNTKPVVWSLCDVNALSGGCHYPGDCSQFMQPEGCGTCPHLRGARDQNYARKNFATKRKLVRSAKFPVHFVPPAEWMNGMVQKSVLFGKSAESSIIPHMSDETVYRPLPRDFCRDLLNLQPAENYLLHIGDTGTVRKGFNFLLEAWGAIPNSSTRLIHLGGIAPFHKDAVKADQRITAIAGIQDERTLAALYNAADAIVIPSLEENLALTFIDSQLCGTPAITFDIGGFQEHIENGKNGLKAGEPNAEELRSSLIHFLSNRDQFNKKQIATDALRKFGQSSLAPKYINLYQSLLQ